MLVWGQPLSAVRRAKLDSLSVTAGKLSRYACNPWLPRRGVSEKIGQSSPNGGNW